MLIVEIGERMRALYISPSFYSASGLKPEDTTDGGRELLSMIHPDDRTNLSAASAMALRRMNMSIFLPHHRREGDSRVAASARAAYRLCGKPLPGDAHCDNRYHGDQKDSGAL